MRYPALFLCLVFCFELIHIKIFTSCDTQPIIYIIIMKDFSNCRQDFIGSIVSCD